MIILGSAFWSCRHCIAPAYMGCTSPPVKLCCKFVLGLLQANSKAYTKSDIWPSSPTCPSWNMLYTIPVTPNLVIIIMSFKRQNLHNLNGTKPTQAQWAVFHKAKNKLSIVCQIQRYFREDSKLPEICSLKIEEHCHPTVSTVKSWQKVIAKSLAITAFCL